ncbi:MAG TPA: TetR/AcrR family transcriptional regulator [Steroidobacteraceae bacterium]|nr:TetR/AcrR family transcriptional regulator [Steroidobacteraceae bacterium]
MKSKRSKKVARFPRTSRRSFRRRLPRQQRAQITLEAILDAVVRILKKQGIAAVNTNRIAAVAGVSIGSVYQYFPDKRAIFVALHERHVQDIDRRIERTLVEHLASSLEGLIRGLVDTVVAAHSADPELYELLLTEVPHRGDGTQDLSSRLHGALRSALASSERKLGARRNLDLTAFVMSHMVDALAHGAALRRPAGVTLEDAKEEAVRAIVAYFQQA